MRSIATLFVLGLMMAVVHRVIAGGPLEARATLALGFLLLAAVGGGSRAPGPLPTHGISADRFRRLGRVLGLVRREEVEALRFIGHCAVALIGLAAGSGSTLDALASGSCRSGARHERRDRFPLCVVSLVLVSVGPWFPLTRHQPLGDAVVVALVLGHHRGRLSSPAVIVR